MLVLPVYSQDMRISEEDVRYEDKFVEATLLFNKGKRKEAIKILDTLRREMQSPSSTVFLTLAKWNYEEKDIAQCENFLKQAIATDPGSEWILQFGFQFFKETGRFEDANAMADKLIALQPQKVIWRDQKIRWLMAIQKYTYAIAALESKEMERGFSTDVSLQKIECFQKTGQTDLAVKEAERLIDTYPDEKKYLQLAAAVLHEAGRVSEARPYLEKILLLDPRDADAKAGLAILSNQRVTGDDVLVNLKTVMADPQISAGKKIETLLPFVLQLVETRDTILGASLESLGEIVVRLHPTTAACHAVYADILKSIGKRRKAIDEYRQALTISQRPFSVWEQLFFCLEGEEDWSGLKESCGASLDYFPNQTLPYIFLALAQIHTAEMEKATQNLDEATLIAAGNPDLESRIQCVLGIQAYYQKKLPSALQYADESLRLSQGSNAMAWELKGDVLKSQGKLTEAAACFSKSLELDDSRLSPFQKLNQK